MNRPHLEGCPNIDCHNNKDCCPFRKIVIPSVMGGDSEGEDYAPENGAYRNALVEYESNGHIYMYSSDGIPTRMTGESGVSDYEALTNKPSINGHELVGNKTAEELGITSEPFYALAYAKEYVTSPFTLHLFKDAALTAPYTSAELYSDYESGKSLIVVYDTVGELGRRTTVYNNVIKAYRRLSPNLPSRQEEYRFMILNNRAGYFGADAIGFMYNYDSTSNFFTMDAFSIQKKLTAGDGITISGTTISATGGGGATMFYASLQNVRNILNIYTDSSQTDNVDGGAMIAALSRGPVMIQDVNDNNIYVTVVSANGSSNPVSIVIDMYDDMGDPARRRFRYDGPGWVENRF